MKILIATDIHGSSYWAKRVKEKFIQTNADVLVLLGDVYNHGPRNPFPQDYKPMDVAATLSGIPDILVIQGNCDSEVDQMISGFAFVKENILFLGKRKLFFTHGHVHSKDNLPNLAKGDVMFYGHTHVNEIADVNGVICVNVGSCALPKDGKSTYCLADEKGITVFDFDGGVVCKHVF